MLLVVDVVSDSDKERFWPEVRIDDGITVSDLKDKLYIKTGTNPSRMNLFAFHPCNPLSKIFLDDNLKSLDQYSLSSGYTIQVVESKNSYTLDINQDSGNFNKHGVKMDYYTFASSNSKLYEHYMKQLAGSSGKIDESKFVKYEMSDEDYEKRGTGVKDFIQRMRTKTDSRSRVASNPEDSSQKIPSLTQLKGAFPLESRCCVSPGNRRGCVKFVGYVDKLNVKIGVSLDEPLGYSDGSYNNLRFFETGPNYGGFFEPADVKVGDYPPLDPFDMVQ